MVLWCLTPKFLTFGLGNNGVLSFKSLSVTESTKETDCFSEQTRGESCALCLEGTHQMD